ncbi:solute carrier family 12 member 8 isoform X2 [Spea bombifrons]|uniref:solute carrier family 12 member 8 isoform X2 n=1 Tax=Spea bombifrons TaxID=233779 RepID=UPI00234A8D6E|nr:solute carrier family 12 member 8 isoform X2 [Spea bombifrons]
MSHVMEDTMGVTKPTALNGSMSGSESVKDLFHEDAQVSQLQSRPWWKIQLFVWEPVLFGTWDGVFTSCMINIFGVVLFLRTGWLVGNTGVLLGMFLVSFVIVVALVTVLSGIGVCERCSIGSGGVYSMISTVLGGKVGGTVGLLYIFGQCVAGAMYITGFAESIADVLRLENIWAVRGISLAVLLGLLAINLAGVKWIIRLQLLLLLLLAVSTLDFVIGSFTHLDPDHGFVGYSEELLRNNTFPDYSPGETFFTVFGVFFPTATGVMAGFNMSGDLKRPASDIPLGSLAAIAISWFLYIVFVFLLGAICSREFLRYEFMIAEKVSLVGFLFLLGLYISSLASCMGGLYGAPRILQCIAQEEVIPALAFLAHGVNILAPIVTINFMLTYSAVDYSYFSVTMSYGLQRGPQKARRVGPRTPSSAQPLILNKSAGYGSNGTLLEFTRDMDQLFRAGDAAAADQPQDPDPKRAKKARRARKPAKETLQDSFQLDFQERPEDAAPGTPPDERAPYPPEGAEEPDDRRRAEDQTFTEDPQSGAESKEDLNIQNKSLGFEIQSLSASFYSKLCNHWVSFLGAILSIVIMFVIQWIYALANIAVAVLLYFYIGRVSPGLNPGVAANFSFFSWIRGVAATACRKKPPPEEHFVVTPSFASVGMETTQLTEENADFASRGRFHRSSIISRGQFVNQFN